MRIQKRIFWTTLLIALGSLGAFIYCSFQCCDDTTIKNILTNIFISLFGSSILVCIPSFISFIRLKSEAKDKIIVELAKLENLINDMHFSTTFIKDFNGEYDLDFSYEQIKLDPNANPTLLKIKQELYTNACNKLDKLYGITKRIEEYNYAYFDELLNDYTAFWHTETTIKSLLKYFDKITNQFQMSNFRNGQGKRHYDCCNASPGQFFGIWFKGFLVELNPIEDKLKELKNISLTLRILFFKSTKTAINNTDKKIKESILLDLKDFYNRTNILSKRKIKKILKLFEEKENKSLKNPI